MDAELESKLNEINMSQSQQLEADNLLEEQKEKNTKINELSDYQYNKNLEKIKELFEQDNAEETKLIEKYKNSQYYDNYLYIVSNLNSILNPYVKSLEQQYNACKNYCSESILDKLKAWFLLSNVSFNVPETLRRDLENKMEEEANKIKSLNDIHFNVEIEKIEYTRRNINSNIVRKIDSYQVKIITVKEKQKRKLFKK